MAKLTLRQEAIDDLSDIWEYTFRTWSEKQADDYYAMIKSACLEISENPTIGRHYNIVDSALLGYRIGKHIIFYETISVNEVEIIRVLHGRMNLRKRLIDT